MTREKALEIATQAHAGQKRNNGNGVDYITHPIAVAENAEKMFWSKYADDYVDGVDAIARKIYIVGVLHDVIEDTSVNLAEISKQFPDTHILQALSMLTRREGTTYYDFIKIIATEGSILALIVKIEDIKHNMSDLKEGSLKDKYRFALKILEDALHSYHVLS
jgi:(p)ppGpp synthase/HD superfamily hydrolase